MEINSKICTKCKKNRPFYEFYKSKLGKYKLKAKCKRCQAAESVIYQQNNKEKIAAYGRKRRKEKAGKISAQRARYIAENKERFKEYRKQWVKENIGKVNAKTAKRRAQKRNATPKWLTKVHWEQIEAFYTKAAKLKQETGIPHEVDHIIPLQGNEVRGLHVPWNLQVITKSENRHKSRKILF
jgi:hypothetical protein